LTPVVDLVLQSLESQPAQSPIATVACIHLSQLLVAAVNEMTKKAVPATVGKKYFQSVVELASSHFVEFSTKDLAGTSKDQKYIYWIHLMEACLVLSQRLKTEEGDTWVQLFNDLVHLCSRSLAHLARLSSNQPFDQRHPGPVIVGCLDALLKHSWFAKKKQHWLPLFQRFDTIRALMVMLGWPCEQDKCTHLIAVCNLLFTLSRIPAIAQVYYLFLPLLNDLGLGGCQCISTF
jgi:hypothetical protein